MGFVVGAALIGAAVFGAVKSSKAAGKASKAEQEAGEESLAFQKEIFETTEANAAPNIASGQLALQTLLFELGLGRAPKVGPRVGIFGINTPRFEGFQETPGFKFAFQKGVDAVDASAAAGGGLFSGSTLEDLTTFGQGFAAQEQGKFLDRLQTLVSSGQTGVGQVSGSGTAFAQTGSATIEGIGNAQAAGIIGKNNAFQQGLSGVTTGLGQIAGGFAGLSF